MRYIKYLSMVLCLLFCCSLISCNRTLPVRQLKVCLVGYETDASELEAIFKELLQAIPIGNGAVFKKIVPRIGGDLVEIAAKETTESSVFVILNAKRNSIPGLMAMAKKAGIALIFTGDFPDKDTLGSYTRAYFVGADSRAETEELVRVLKKTNEGKDTMSLSGSVLFIQGGINTVTAMQKADALRAEMATKGIRVSGKSTLSIPDLSRITTRDKVRKFLEKHKEITFIAATDDSLTLGAYDAVRQLNSKVTVYGMNSGHSANPVGDFNTVLRKDNPQKIGNAIAQLAMHIWNVDVQNGPSELPLSPDSRWNIVPE